MFTLIASLVLAGPVPSQEQNTRLFSPSFNGFWANICSYLPHSVKIFCARDGDTQCPTTPTPFGSANGVVNTPFVNRFVVRYASAQRWQPSTMATTWQLPDATNTSTLPLMCPQPFVSDSTYSEDCLAMVLYIPSSLTDASLVPTLVWIHGGSFMVGSASNPGLDGSALAQATGSIVAVIQYRLGALGFIAPNGETNLGLKDVVNGLQFLHNVLPSFGGDKSKITLAGQSSGANMIRALLAVPSAQSLFQSAILQSDPMDYGFLSVSNQQQLQDYFVSLLPCQVSDTACLNALSVDEIVNNIGLNQFFNASQIVPAATQMDPMRVVRDGSFITSTLDSSSPFPAVSKPILLSTVMDEAGYTIYGNFPNPVPQSEYQAIVNASFGETRSQVLMDTQPYAVQTSPTSDYRPQLEVLGTDSVFRCATWTFARNWVSHGGTAYVGMYTVGASYPGNSQVPYCTQPNVVCHQDDIEIVFGTVQNPTAAQSMLISEMQARYKSFMYDGDPNPSDASYSEWQAAGASAVNAILLGSSGEAPIGACTADLWGSSIEYDYQLFDI
ncbi:Alpha/Beta hydrolase protein [Pisolithus marmoratus]|nr:Alpha/Beta hydrolase protein [Pisolithus marmoratus]